MTAVHACRWERDSDALYERGAAAWTELALHRDAFRAHVERLARTPRPEHAADLFLACACAQRVPGALEAFDARLGPEIDATLRRLAVDADARDEVRQLVRTRLFAHDDGAKIAAYAGDAPLAFWVRLVAARTTHNVNRRERPHRATTRDDLILSRLAEPRATDGVAMKAELVVLYKSAFERAFASLDPRDKTLLRCSIVDGLTIDELARVLRIHRATAARRVVAVREKLAELTRSNLGEEAQLGAEEIHSAFRLIESQLEISVERVFLQVEPDRSG